METTNQYNLDLSFINPVQEDFFYDTKRNQGFSGGFGNGKTMGASMKALTLLTTFPKYRIAGTRYTGKDLQTSTMSTFFKKCPPELYSEVYGGRRSDREGYLRLVNGSEIFWIHLDDYSETSLRGLEVNSRLGDQDEEISEGVYLIMDSRLERWDMAEIPAHLNAESFPKNPFTGKPMPPCYNMSLVNPDTTVHWWYKRFHPDAIESQKYRKTHSFFSASMHDNPAIPQSLKDTYLTREKKWVDRYYWGKWGVAGGTIFYVNKESVLEVAAPDIADQLTTTTGITQEQLDKLLEIIRRDGIKYRVMDHGESAPTCCLWFAYLTPSVLFSNYGVMSKGIYICYREYYMPDKLVSYHREAISTLSGDEKYAGNYADPDIFRKHSQKYGGRWTVADEYFDSRINKPPIIWQPADNNEMATRNAIGEMLQFDPMCLHPMGCLACPQILFLKRHTEYNPNGVAHVISQTQSARFKKIGSVNGEDIYSDDRAEDEDHALDPLRYFSLIPKMTNLPSQPAEVPQFSFANHLKKQRMNRYTKRGGVIYGR